MESNQAEQGKKVTIINEDFGKSVTPSSIITFTLEGSQKEKEKREQKIYLKKE